MLFSSIKHSLVFVSLSVLAGVTHAKMSSLSDQALSEVDGAGIGLVMDDFVFSHGHNPSEDKVFRISGLTNSEGDPVVVNVDQLYIARSGSNYGANLDPVNLGRLNNPYEIDLIDGDDIGIPGQAVLQFAAPTKVDASVGYDCLDANAAQGSGECSSRPSSAGWLNGERPDMGLQLEVTDGALTNNLNFHAKSAVFDGSYVRLWGDDTSGKMAAEFRLNFYTPELEISNCSKTNESCGSSVKMRGFEFELALGNNFQPLYFGVNQNGAVTMEIENITHQYLNNIDFNTGQSDGSVQGDEAYAFYNDYYTNTDFRTNIRVEDIQIGTTSLGSAKVDGLLVQYLDLELRDLN